MTRRRFSAAALALCLVLVPGSAGAREPEFTPGSAGLGDPYFPLDGNGGYDVLAYDLAVRYDPATDALSGVATIKARALQGLSSFNLDLDGLAVDSVSVNGAAASWTHQDGELTVTPATGIRNRTRFVAVVAYHGSPEPLPDGSGFIHTDDGALVVGEPHVASTWFPANDHPSDRAEFYFKVTVPTGIEVVANGVLDGTRRQGEWTQWVWDQHHPMATYLAGMIIGEVEIDAYRSGGIRFWDAIDPNLFDPIATAVTGSQFAISQQADSSYKRLMRTIDVPADGATLSFWVTRDVEPFFDFFFVEAHTPGLDDWTTLPDAEGNAIQETGGSCPFWLELHPFLAHYQAPPSSEFEPCAPTGTTGEWWASSFPSAGAEQWTVDLSAWAGSQVEVALTYASDDVVQLSGVFIDDIVVSTGEGNTSFEDDGDTMDGWTVPGAPEGSPGNENDWIVGTEADVPPPVGEQVRATFAKQPEILGFLASFFGPYPFKASGGIVDDIDVGFALENQTRPIYSPGFFRNPIDGELVVVHELAHQWFGDDLTLEQWQHIWLNEGFATYAEWLWAEANGYFTAQEFYDLLAGIPADDPFWTVVIGDPGPDLMFDPAVYFRGAMTLHQLRLDVGDDAFFAILAAWADQQAGRTVTTAEFIALAEEISGQQLDAFFDEWLFTGAKPGGLPEVSGFGERAPSVPGAPDRSGDDRGLPDRLLDSPRK